MSDVPCIVILGFAGVFIYIADRCLTWLAWQLSGIKGPPIRSTIASLVLRWRILSFTGMTIAHLSTAARLNLPLGRTVLLASRDERGQLRTILGRLGQWLNKGTMLSVALEHSIPACPSFVTSMVRAGEDSGQLRRALATLETMIEDRQRRIRSGVLGNWVYPVVLFFVWATVVSYTMAVIVPRFREIFLDFGAVLPPITRALIDFADEVVFFSSVLFFAMLLVGAALAVVVLLSVRPRRVDSPRLLSRVGDTLRWYLPILHGIDRGFGFAASVDALAMGLAGGLPLDRAVQLAGDVDVNIHVRRRFRWFGRLMGDGQPPGAAATQAGLGPVITGAIRSVVHGAQPQAALEHAARYHRATAYRWWHCLGHVIGPMVTLIAACAVGFVAVALFTPLITLMDSVVTGLE
ncbi:MAG: type II secretion system F family protein [Phycisphaerales bacterium]|nr:MAG: type II secretion system F family protein [Phycisphaerales bacterium]